MPEASSEETLGALRNPKVGMRFHEPHGHYVVVDFIDHNMVMWHDEYSSVPQASTVETFVNRYTHGPEHIKPWVLLLVADPPHTGEGI